MNVDQNYLALDLEMTQPNNKIIQIGITIGSASQNEKDWHKQYWFVDPGEEISEEITNLTGITNEDVIQRSTPLAEIALELSELINKHNAFVNPITWGGGDSHLLLNTFKSENIEFRHFGHRWIDVKTFYIFNNIAKGKSLTGGLSSAMGLYKLHFKGDKHRADEDAFNTLRLFFHLVERQAKLEKLLVDMKEI